MKKMITMIAVFAFTAGTTFGQIASHVVISEVYGGGGNSGAPYKNDYVELYNPTDNPVDLTNWSIQYGSASGSTYTPNVIASGTIASHGFFLIQLAAGAGTQTNPWTADASPASPSNLSATTGKVALVNGTTAITGPTDLSVVDFVGFGTANASEGTLAPAPSNSTSIERKAKSTSTAGTLASGGLDETFGNGWDSNSNGSDFVSQSSLSPQTTASSVENPPTGNSAPLIGSISKSSVVPGLSETLTLSTSITDVDGTISAVKMVFSVNGGEEDSSVTVTNPSGSTYEAIIPASAHLNNGDRVYYYFIAYDNNDARSESIQGGYFAGTSPISTDGIKSVDESGNLIYAGYYVQVEGVCTIGGTSAPTYSLTTLQAYLQDESGAINIFNNGSSLSMVKGNAYRVVGPLAVFSGLTEITPPTITDLGATTPLPYTVVSLDDVAANPEAYEGLYIAIQGLQKDLGVWGNNATLTLSKGANSIGTFLDGDVTNWTLLTEPSYPADFAGIFTQVAAGTALSNYSLRPTSSTDFGAENSLPVELTSFTLSSSGKGINLAWSTATESNNLGWDVESSSQNSEVSSQKWTKIGFVAGKGTTTESQSYEFQVESSKFNATGLQFRLKQIDLDGSVSYSKILTYTEIPTVFGVRQNYPNPFNPTTNIRFDLPKSANVKIVVSNILGQQIAVVADREFSAGTNIEVPFNAANLASGLYYYTITVDHKSVTKTMMLMK